jgi:hypothetical protein
LKAEEIKEFIIIPRCTASVMEYIGSLHIEQLDAKRELRVRRATKKAIR